MPQKKIDKINEEINKQVLEKGVVESEKFKKTIIWTKYPRSISLVDFGFIFLVISLMSFVLLVNFHSIAWIGSLIYISIICFSVASISLFSIKLYNENEYKNQRDLTSEEIFNKINEFFADKVTTIADFQEVNNFINPTRTIIVEHKSRGKFRIDCNAYDPSKFFGIQEIKEDNKS